MSKMILIDEATVTKALEALEAYNGFIDDAHILEGQWHWIDGADNAQAPLREALAEQPAQQEPDCWAILTPNGSRLVSPDEAKGRKDAYALYTSPPAPRPWVGLSHDEYDAICDKHSTMSDFDFLEDIEAKIKEKNNG